MKKFVSIFLVGILVGVLALHWWAVYRINAQVQLLIGQNQILAEVAQKQQTDIQTIVNFLNGKIQGQQQ